MSDKRDDDDGIAAEEVRADLHALVQRICGRTPPGFHSEAERDTMFALLVALSVHDPNFPAFVAGLPLSAQRTMFERVPSTLAAIPARHGVH